MRRSLARSWITGLLFAGLLCSSAVLAAPALTTLHIQVDQFGYRRSDQKVAVLSDPQAGYNAARASRMLALPFFNAIREAELDEVAAALLDLAH